MEQAHAAQAQKPSVTTRRINVSKQLVSFLSELDRAFALSDSQRAAVRNDFMQGIDMLLAQGMPMAEILRRLDPNRLGGFYARPGQGFYPLDNGAKQYALSMLDGQMAMFRLSAALDAPVDPVILQLALTFTLRRFPHYATRLCRGAFWYCLKPYTGRYTVIPQSDAVCAPINVSDETQALFRVMYRGSRVSVELFHILSDGMGGMTFLKTLLTEYYRLQGEDAGQEDVQALDTAMPAQPEEVENSFTRFRSRERGGRLLGAPAVHIPAVRLPGGECRTEQYVLSAAKMKQTARQYGVSVTALMSAVILTASQKTARAKSGRYRLQITVDLRRLFASRTLRNFSWYGAAVSDAGSPLHGRELAKDLQEQIQAITQRDALENNVSAAQRMIRRLRFVPLQWKTMLIRAAYRMTGDFFFTSTLSNLGVIALHGPLKAHVLEIVSTLGPSPGNPYSFALTTVHDRAALSVTRTTNDLTMLDNLEESARSYGLSMIRKG